jgi:uncharacterized protein involved in response to NO
MPSTSTSTSATTSRRGGVPRGLRDTGPIILSYGFRPFFLAGAFWATAAMVFWMGSLFAGVPVGADYGAAAWHAHEMLFGFGSAILAGFLLTAVPNWTGRLPVSGPPLLCLFLIWLAGRAALLVPGLIGLVPAVLIESLFLPALLAICLREIIAGRKWADLKVMAGLAVLCLANLCFHFEVVSQGMADRSPRLAAAAYTMMIVIVGGRMLPSFTRNWLSKSGRTDFPTPYGTYDLWAISLTAPALALWVVMPEGTGTAAAAGLAAILQAIRLFRWRGWTTFKEPLVTVLHAAYAFVPLGLSAIAASACGLLDGVAALHVLTIGTIASMMLAVMTRATRGHTGRELAASRLTCVGYCSLFACALVRPMSAFAPGHFEIIYGLAGVLWLVAFSVFLIEYGPMLVARRRTPAVRQG